MRLAPSSPSISWWSRFQSVPLCSLSLSFSLSTPSLTLRLFEVITPYACKTLRLALLLRLPQWSKKKKKNARIQNGPMQLSSWICQIRSINVQRMSIIHRQRLASIRHYGSITEFRWQSDWWGELISWDNLLNRHWSRLDSHLVSFRVFLQESQSTWRSSHSRLRWSPLGGSRKDSRESRWNVQKQIEFVEETQWSSRSVQHVNVSSFLAPSSDQAETSSKFTVEYAKSNRSTCHGCQMKIDKDLIRLARNVVVTHEHGYGSVDQWYHIDCFKERKDQLNFDGTAETSVVVIIDSLHRLISI